MAAMKWQLSLSLLVFVILFNTIALNQDKVQPLPKFGEWDVNNPASAEGFTVIFNKARDERKANADPGAMPAPPRNNIGGYKLEDDYDFPRKNSKWFCCA